MDKKYDEWPSSQKLKKADGTNFIAVKDGITFFH